MKKEIKVWDYAGRIMEAIDEGILLTTAAQGEKDTMVIGWGHIGVIWGKPVFVAYVRESRHTKSLVDKNGEFTVNIALVDGQQPVMGVIYVPAKGDLYWGSADGAFKASVPCGEVFPDVEDIFPQSSSLPLQGAVHDGFVVVASRSHMSIETQDYVNELSRIHRQVELISSGSSIKICMVAEGAADAYPRYAPTMEWDTAAGDAIARASGCSVINAETGCPLKYNKEDLLNPWFLVESGEK